MSFCSYPFNNPAGVSESAGSQHLLSGLRVLCLGVRWREGEKMPNSLSRCWIFLDPFAVLRAAAG